MEIITLTKAKKMRNQNQHLAHITETLISINPTTQLSNLAIISIKTINNKPTLAKLKINHQKNTYKPNTQNNTSNNNHNNHSQQNSQNSTQPSTSEKPNNQQSSSQNSENKPSNQQNNNNSTQNKNH